MSTITTDAPKVLTFAQYVEAKHRAAAARHSLTLAEVRRELPAEQYRADWRDHVVTSFDQGGDIPPRLWNTFDEGLQYRVLRSPRALRDHALTHELRARGVADAR